MRRLFCFGWLISVSAMSHAAVTAPTPSATPPLKMRQAMRLAQVPAPAWSAMVVDLDSGRTLLSHLPQLSRNPASVMKLVTTDAALDVLGATFTWKTQLSVYGHLEQGTLKGSVLVRGSGDPKLVVERLEPMLQALRGAGIHRIEGDIILDRRAFVLAPVDPAQFDGEPLRPYNAAPDALLINFKSLVMTFTPDEATGVARVAVEPPMAGMQIDSTVPLGGTSCGDWRALLRARIDDPSQLRFAGRYAAACGERVWPSAYVDPDSHSARAIAGMWQRVGGSLSGLARNWRAPDAQLQNAPPLWQQSFDSLPLSEIVRDVNKFSNNVMAQHLLLTLGTQRLPQLAAQDTRQAGRDALAQWWRTTFPAIAAPTVDNGSGLSRTERIRPDALMAVLLHAARSPVADTLLESLPVAGMDSTMRLRATRVAGQAFIKTGTLKDVTAIAGYVNGQSGKRYAVVGIVNHDNAPAAKPALDELINWVAQQ